MKNGRTISVSEIENLFDFEDQEIEDAYEKVSKINDGDLGIEDLLFKKLYEYHLDYKAGRLKDNDEVNIYDGVILCDKYRKEYELSTSSLFKDVMECITKGYYKYDEFNDSYGFFPTVDQIEEDIDFKDYIEDNTFALKGVISKGIAHEYIEMRKFSNMLEWRYTSDYVPDCVMEGVNDGNGLNYWDVISGNEVYNIFDSDKFREYCGSNYIEMDAYEKSDRFAIYLMETGEIYKFIGDFIDVRNRCLEAYYICNRIKEGRTDDLKRAGLDDEEIDRLRETYERSLLTYSIDLESAYKELSINDFELDEDWNLHVVNNQEIYSYFGIDDKYLEAEREEEFER